jgi:hypothetical protein
VFVRRGRRNLRLAPKLQETTEDKFVLRASITLALSLALGILGASGATALTIKKSSSNICHCPGGSYYEQTGSKNTFSTIDACLSSGGRHPERGQGNCQATSAAITTQKRPDYKVISSRQIPAYDREKHFGGWADYDRDCQNTRQEMLASLSTSRVLYASNNCTVMRGRWLDPYTNEIFLDAKDLDIDHMVPLAYAWEHGAYRWTQEQRQKFANDPVNLFAVKASVNRQKGASGPLEWLPPSQGYHCQYVTRFLRISQSYGLVFQPDEIAEIHALKLKTCGK